MVLTGEDAVAELRRVERELDAHHRQLEALSHSGTALVRALLRAFQLASIGRHLRFGRRDRPLQLLAAGDELAEGLAQAVQWVYQAGPGPAPPSEVDGPGDQEVRALLEHARAYSVLCWWHVAVSRGICTVTYDTCARRFSFEYSDGSVRAGLASFNLALGKQLRDASFPAAWQATTALLPLVPRYAHVEPGGRLGVDWSVLSTKEGQTWISAYGAVGGSEHPDDWSLGTYTLGQHARFRHTLALVAFVWQAAFMLAWHTTSESSDILDACLLVMLPNEWGHLLARASGLPADTVQAIVGDLTYGPPSRRLDPLLQPFLPVGDPGLALAPAAVSATAAEANALRLMTRDPERKRLYDDLSTQKEGLFLAEILPVVGGLGLPCATRRQSKGMAGDIDLLLLDRHTGVTLVVELKWLLPALSPADVFEEDDQLRRAVESQVVPAVAHVTREWSRLVPAWIPEARGRQPGRVLGMVVSKHAGGTGKVFDPGVPVVEWTFLARVVGKDVGRGLACVWRRCRNRPDRRQILSPAEWTQKRVRFLEYTYSVPGLRLPGDAK